MRLNPLAFAIFAILISTQAVVGQVRIDSSTNPLSKLAGEGAPAISEIVDALDVIIVFDDIALVSVGGASWLVPASALGGAASSDLTLSPSRPYAKTGLQAFKAGPWIDIWGSAHVVQSSFQSLDGTQNGTDHAQLVTDAIAQYPPAAQDAVAPAGAVGKLPYSLVIGGVTYSASSAWSLDMMIAAVDDSRPETDRHMPDQGEFVQTLSASWVDASGTSHNVTTPQRRPSEEPEDTLARHLKAVTAYQEAFPPAPPPSSEDISKRWTGASPLLLAA